nr:MAG TPA: hypothetical protein [Caudoviricetes sp.]
MYYYYRLSVLTVDTDKDFCKVISIKIFCVDTS